MAGKINELVTDEALAKLDKLIADLAIANRSMAEAIQLATQYTAAIGGSKNLAEFVANQEKAAKAIANVNAKIAETRAKEEELSAEREKLTAKQISNERRLQEMAEKRRRVVTENTANEIAAAEAQVREQNRVTAATNNATQAANTHAAAIRNDAAEEARAEATAARYRAARLAATQATNASTASTQAATQAVIANEVATTSAAANVGRALTRGLGYLRTLAYVLPGIGIAGIFNLIYEGLSKLFSSSPKFDKFLDDFKTLNSLMSSAGANSGAEIAKLDALFRAINNANIPLKERNEAVKELRDLYPKHLDNLTIDNAKTKELTEKYKQLKEELISIAYVQAGYNKIAEATARIFEDEFKMNSERVKNLQLRQQVNAAQKAENELNASGVRNRNANNDALDAGVRKTTQLAQAQGKLVESDKIIFDFAKDREIQRQRIELIQKQIDERVKKSGVSVLGLSDEDENSTQSNKYAQMLQQQKQILQSHEQDSYQDRLTAIEAFEGASLYIIEQGVKAKEFTEQEGLTKRLEIQNATNAERLKLDKEIADAEKRQIQELLEQYKVLEQRKEDLIEQGLNQQLLDLEYANSEEILKLTEKYSKGEIREKEYRRRIRALQKDSAAESIDIQVKALEEILAAQEEANKQAGEMGLPFNIDTQATRNKITGLKIKSNQLKSSAGSDNAIGDLANLKESAEEVLLFSQQAVNALNIVGDLIQANTQAKIEALEKEFDLIQQNGNAEKERINNSILSNKEKARQTTIIDNQIAQHRARITQEENEAKRRQAIFDKANAVASILQNTAVAVVKALPNLLLAAIIGGLGAAQLATVIATPLPQFYKGTKNAPEGFAHVGERGTELQINPDGSMQLTPNKDTVTYLQKGTQIIPHEELIAMVAKPQPIYYISGTQVDNKKLEKLMAENNELQKRKPATVVKVIADKWGTYAHRNY